MSNRTQQGRAFTLLELVVVIAVVALMAAVLIRTTIKARDRMGDVACQNNLRQLCQALHSYNVDNNGSMPYGLFYVGSGPPDWTSPPGGNGAYTSWASELNKYFMLPKGYAPAFQCPDAQQQAGAHPVSYVMNMIVAVSPVYEVLIGQPPRAQTKPPKLHLMLRDSPGTAVMWDTPIHPDPQFPEGYLVGADIDGQRFWQGANSPQYRYYSPHDVFGQIPPGVFSHNRPVLLNVGANVYRNIDPPAGASFPWQGNLRFRHEGQTQCNAAFFDGSVRAFTAVVRTDNTVQSHDAIRRYFMINWPPGTPPNTSVPF
jgi:prepilin-type N-terminal cleavage/methylation domain-containing protein/prepilin-type processing-associated H-X9-DG protein